MQYFYLISLLLMVELLHASNKHHSCRQQILQIIQTHVKKNCLHITSCFYKEKGLFVTLFCRKRRKPSYCKVGKITWRLPWLHGWTTRHVDVCMCWGLCQDYRKPAEAMGPPHSRPLMFVVWKAMTIFRSRLCLKNGLNEYLGKLACISVFRGQILSPWLGRDKVDSGIGLSYRPSRLYTGWWAGIYKSMPESTISPSQEQRIWPQSSLEPNQDDNALS